MPLRWNNRLGIIYYVKKNKSFEYRHLHLLTYQYIVLEPLNISSVLGAFWELFNHYNVSIDQILNVRFTT